MQNHRFTFLLAGLLLIIAMPCLNQAGAAVLSTFDSDTEGWTVSGGGVSWSATYGNPPGSLYSWDIPGDWLQVIAPAKFSGPWSSTGNVTADIMALTPAMNYYPAFAISDGNTAYQYFFSTYASNAWQTFSASLNDPNWTLITSNTDWYNWNPPLGAESLSTVLQNVATFHIRTDYQNGADDVYLDNIKAPTVPLPSTTMLLCSALAGLGLLRRRGSL